MPISDNSPSFNDFADLSDPRFKGVWPHFSSLILKKGDPLMTHSALGTGLYLMVDGCVGLTVTNSERATFLVQYESGTAPSIALMLQPEMIELCRYEVVEDCSILFLEKKVCLQFMVNSPVFSKFILEEAQREMNLLKELFQLKNKAN
jgi:signal-transduction protein with cAMP-binding, CBS, and nucleotidyltransferase domain